MRFKFWLKRTFSVLVGAFIILSAVYYVRRHDAASAMREAAIWAALTALVYGASAGYHIARHRQCGLDENADCN
ncbi:MAG TPA: hypothetical protein VFT72_11665 [Opitutaceae bacterium]|nr:hypothetical protein [Opitutaceae bacterium]